MTTDIKPFKIRDVEINPPLVLSPMAGVTDVSFRRLLKRRGGVGLSVSEFISVEGLTRNNPKSKRQMRFYEDERPFAVQIFGGQPERMCIQPSMSRTSPARGPFPESSGVNSTRWPSRSNSNTAPLTALR